MKAIFIAGIVLMVLGAAVLGFDYYSYTTTDKIFQIGPLTATAEQTHTIALPPILGWLLIGGGVCALAFAAWSKKE